MRRKAIQVGLILALGLSACGGSKQKSNTDMSKGDGIVEDALALTETAVQDAGVVDAAPADASVLPEIETDEDTPPPVTFVLNNTSEKPLVLSLDKGWQPVIFAHSGKRPRAKSLLMFPTHCTSSCDVDETEVCPVCEEPEKVRDVIAAEKHLTIEPGDSLEVPWDGLVYKYKNTKGTNERGKKTRCKCWSKESAPEEKYTVQSCGLRLSQDAKKRSEYACTKSKMTLPVDEPIRVELDFKK